VILERRLVQVRTTCSLVLAITAFGVGCSDPESAGGGGGRIENQMAADELLMVADESGTS
jgi:hypothetical protein